MKIIKGMYYYEDTTLNKINNSNNDIIVREFTNICADNLSIISSAVVDEENFIKISATAEERKNYQKINNLLDTELIELFFLKIKN